ncbi:MAG: endonuclease domain-containing protein [Actinomycetota bacterium]|nr:endonuclease domain-containing protein [Actinomycetota bacterium]
MFTTAEALDGGLTMAELRWGEQTGRWRRIEKGAYADGPDDPTAIDRALGSVLLTGGVASGHLAGVLLGLDSVHFSRRRPYLTLPKGTATRRPGVSHRCVVPERITSVAGIRCTDGLQTLVDLSAWLDDLRWEQALESGLRKTLLTVGGLEDVLCELGRTRTSGTRRIRRVLALRPPGAPATESLLETLMVQLVRAVAGVGEPVRQYEVYDAFGRFVARVDLAWPEIGLFIELDGQQDKDQPLYDARRETAVVAATGWLCGRFTWREVVHLPTTTARNFGALAEQARLRPLARR